MACTYLLQLNVSIKNTGAIILLALKHTRHQLLQDGVGLGGLDVDSVKDSSDYFAYLCIPACEITLHQKRMLMVDRFRLRCQIVETN
jgi:hypothetical protein